MRRCFLACCGERAERFTILETRFSGFWGGNQEDGRGGRRVRAAPVPNAVRTDLRKRSTVAVPALRKEWPLAVDACGSYASFDQSGGLATRIRLQAPCLIAGGGDTLSG